MPRILLGLTAAAALAATSVLAASPAEAVSGRPDICYTILFTTPVYLTYNDKVQTGTAYKGDIFQNYMQEGELGRYYGVDNNDGASGWVTGGAFGHEYFCA